MKMIKIISKTTLDQILEMIIFFEIYTGRSVVIKFNTKEENKKGSVKKIYNGFKYIQLCFHKDGVTT